MAEKYGQMPKRFSKAWWEHYWYYYKWHTGFVVLAAAVLAVTVGQCASRIDYDMTMSYIGCNYYYPQNLEIFCDAAEKIISDADENGSIDATVIQMNVAKDGTASAGTDYNNTMYSKIAVEFQAGETYLYLLNRQELDRLLSRESAEQIFVKTTDIYDGEIADECLVKKDGVPYAVKVEGNRFLEDNRFFSEDVYLAVRCMRGADKKKQRQQILYKNALDFAKHIVENAQ